MRFGVTTVPFLVGESRLFTIHLLVTMLTLPDGFLALSWMRETSALA